MDNKEIQKIVTEKILSKMREGKLVWSRDWSGEKKFSMPYNGLTKAMYKGVNFWSLLVESEEKGFLSGNWVTFCQIQDLAKTKGYTLEIIKGSKASKVVFYRLIDLETKKDATDESKKVLPILKYSNVFNFSQVKGLEAEVLEANKINSEIKINAEKVNFNKLNATIVNAPQVRAFYNSVSDVVTLPMISQFQNESAFYATSFHELIHWTGHESRLNRDLKNKFGSKEYAFEELIAEFGASYLCASYGINYETQHAAYLQSWIEALESDETMLFKAIGQAQKAADYVLNLLNASEAQESKEMELSSAN